MMSKRESPNLLHRNFEGGRPEILTASVSSRVVRRVNVTMLASSNVDIVQTMRLFANHGIDCTFIVPTATGLQKSIMDATTSVRDYLNKFNLHDFSQQEKGPNHKVTLQTVIITDLEIADGQTSLYRPETKDGDPRIWISRLNSHANENDLIALVACDKKLVAINCKRANLEKLLTEKSSPFWDTYRAKPTALPPEAAELAGKLTEICSRGFIQTLRAGDTGVGYTLETLLGIAANSSKSPDYKGIEIKSGRSRSVARGRTTIISLVPNWKLSRLKSSKELLNERGRFNQKKNRIQLFHELSALKSNSYDMKLRVEEKRGFLHQETLMGLDKITDVTWEFSTLSERLNRKHGKTFWVKADANGSGSAEEFWYNRLIYTSGINPSKLPLLIETGVVTVDYTIKEKPTGGAKDQGYLFKINQADLDLMFEAPQKISIC